MKLLVLASVTAIIVVGVFGIYFAIEYEKSSQPPTPIPYPTGEKWAIDYEGKTSFPINIVNQRMLYYTAITNDKFYGEMQSLSDFKKSMRDSYQGNVGVPYGYLANFTHVMHLDGTWTNHRDLIQETLEGIEGVKKAYLFESWES